MKATTSHDPNDKSESMDRRRSRSRSRDRRRDSRDRRDKSRDRDRKRRSRSRSQGPLTREERELDDLTKDQRTIFVSQLVNKVRERNLEDFFGQIGKVNNVIMLRDRVTDKHKGFAYVEMNDLESIPNCILFNNIVPDFQKFPILVKASEAEKNFLAKASSQSIREERKDGNSAYQPQKRPQKLTVGEDGDARVYIGNIHVSINESTLKSVLEPFGEVDDIRLHRDDLGNSKGFAFVKFRRPQSAQICMSTLGGVELIGRPLKVGPVKDNSSHLGSSSFIPDASTAALLGHALSSAPSSGSGAASSNWKLDDAGSDKAGIQMNAMQRAQLMQKLGASAGLSVPVPQMQSQIQTPNLYGPSGPAGTPSTCVQLTNMFDLAEETEPNWDLDVQEDVMEECRKYGNVETCFVEKHKPGGLIYLRFNSILAASQAAMALNGRFFAGRTVVATFIDPVQFQSLF